MRLPTFRSETSHPSVSVPPAGSRRRSLVLVALALGLALAGCRSEETGETGAQSADWPYYGGDEGGQRHSPLTQISPANVDQLEVAWTYHTGDLLDPSNPSSAQSGSSHASTSFQNTPILVDGTLYLCTPFNRVIALDPETGDEKWTFDPKVDLDGLYLVNCRGVSAWTDARAEEGATCQKRLFMGTIDGRMLALDAPTGRPCPEFGQNGVVDLREGVGDPQPGEYGVTSPPVILRDRLITGSMVLDNRRVDAPSGVVRAYSARTGERLWAWNALPPGEPTNQVGPFRQGTSNAWSALSADSARDLVFVPTGNSSPDYFGGHRNGLDYYSSSIVALDGESGKPVWHFQAVHHDIWDYDIGAQPVTFDFPVKEGSTKDGTRPGMLAPTKMGHLFFLDRVTGKPLFPVEERAVPQAGVVPEEGPISPTQPFPTKPRPLHPGTLSADEAFGFTPWDRKACRKLIESARSEGIFTPPATEGTIQYPGMVGGMNWGSVSVDSGRRLVVVNNQRIATYIRMVPRAEYDEMVAKAGEAPTFGFEPQAGTPYALERRPLLSPGLGAPCNPPPWGTLAAIDLSTGEVAWEVPLGNTRGLAPWPIWWMLGDIGVPNLGGPITTASGLTFIGATTDGYLRAFATETGKELWKAHLPAAAHATPMTFQLGPEGRQYVVVAAGGHMLLGSKPGDALVAFALPR
ncbi:MAG: pyrroloquinoline quinone-dependent dehydrogenase [Deltaproteobacteria bacterium]|nr:pyrroloquinoline quinone-dependent dehydrogenase [Deltaproteobacteria bacterium]